MMPATCSPALKAFLAAVSRWSGLVGGEPAGLGDRAGGRLVWVVRHA